MEVGGWDVVVTQGLVIMGLEQATGMMLPTSLVMVEAGDIQLMEDMVDRVKVNLFTCENFVWSLKFDEYIIVLFDIDLVRTV